MMTANSDADAAILAACACTDELRALLRDEISAIHTYRRAMENGAMGAHVLAPRLREHRESALDLRLRLYALGGDASVTAPLWDEFVGGSDGTLGLPTNGAALTALRRGEALGQRRYEAAIGGSILDGPSQELVRSRLLPRQESHVLALADVDLPR